MISRLTQWQMAINNAPSSVLAPTTKHILLALSLFMDKDCRCFPSTKTQAKKTGLSERSICTHLEIAVRAGYLTRQRMSGKRKGFSPHEYEGLVPVTEPRAAMTEPDDIQLLKEVQSNLPPEPSREEDRPRDCVYEGRIIRLNRRDWEARKKRYGLEDSQIARWLDDRDRWLRRLPPDDRRVADWWHSTWKALEAELEGIRKSAEYARAAPPREDPAQRPAIVVWG